MEYTAESSLCGGAGFGVGLAAGLGGCGKKLLANGSSEPFPVNVFPQFPWSSALLSSSSGPIVVEFSVPVIHSRQPPKPPNSDTMMA